MPIAIAVAIDTVSYVEHQYVAEIPIPYARSYSVALSLGTERASTYLCYLNATVDGESLSYVAVVLADIARPCMGRDLARALGTNWVTVELGSKAVDVKGICKQSWLNPFIALPLRAASGIEKQCTPIELYRTQSSVLEVSQHLSQDIASALLLVRNSALVAYIAISIPAAMGVLHRISTVIETLRVVGTSRSLILLSLVIGVEILTLLSVLLGAALGTVASHVALTVASSIALEVPCRPLVLSNLGTYALYAFLTMLGAIAIVFRVSRA